MPNSIPSPSFSSRRATQYFFKHILLDAVVQYVQSCTSTILGMNNTSNSFVWPQKRLNKKTPPYVLRHVNSTSQRLSSNSVRRIATLSTALANNFLPPSVHSSSMLKDSHTGSETQYQSAGTTLSPPALKNGLLRKIMVSILSNIKLSSVLDICQYPVIKNDW